MLTDERGEFRFLGLFPGPLFGEGHAGVLRSRAARSILVQPGMRSVLNVNLNTLFSSIQFAYPADRERQHHERRLEVGAAQRLLHTAGAALRMPLWRTLPGIRVAHARAVFSDTRGVVKLSAGEGSLATGTGNEADMGTAFALATSLYGNNMLQLSGNLGYGSQTGVPSAAFRTSYSRNMGGGSPEVSVTMRQLFLPGRLGAALGGNDSAMPMLRTMAASFDDRTQLTDDLAIQYGFTLIPFRSWII